MVVQKLFPELRDYQKRLALFFARRNAAQFGFNEERLVNIARTGIPQVEPTILFDEEYKFELGGVEFQLFHTPGET